MAAILQFSGILGAGIFVLPYVFFQLPPLLSVIILITLAAVISLANLLYTDIILATPGSHQLAGFAQIYLGPQFRLLSLINLLLVGFGALAAYIKLASGFISLVFPFLPPFVIPSVFLFFLFLIHLSDHSLSSKLFQRLPLISVLLITFLFLSSLLFPLPPALVISSSSSSFDLHNLGAYIFALTGFTIIPEIDQYLRGRRQHRFFLRAATVSGLAAIVAVYLLFIFAVGRISGSSLSQDGISGIFTTSPLLGRFFAAFGAITLFKSSLNFLLVIKETFRRDFNLSPNLSLTLSALVPLTTFILASTSFLNIISLTGAVTVFISLLIICLIRLRLPHTRLHTLAIALTLLVLALILLTTLF